jgi:hypothetical protein
LSPPSSGSKINQEEPAWTQMSNNHRCENFKSFHMLLTLCADKGHHAMRATWLSAIQNCNRTEQTSLQHSRIGIACAASGGKCWGSDGKR